MQDRAAYYDGEHNGGGSQEKSPDVACNVVKPASARIDDNEPVCRSVICQQCARSRQHIVKQPAEFGVNQVIPGWTEALQMMSVGDKWRIACPPHLAYGEQGAGDAIPPNTALVFDIHLIDIRD